MKLVIKDDAAETPTPTERPKRVFLADPYSIIRLTVGDWLKRTPGLTVCGQADNPTIALQSIERLRPDIVVTEIFGEEDCQFIQTLRKQYPRLPILVFSYGNEKWYAPRALQAGADGYLLKGVNAEGLVDAIRNTLEGRVVLSPSMRYQLLVKCTRRKNPRAAMRNSDHRCHSPWPRRLVAHRV
jgi:DNA-binding NarL/FixJ family response regulator